MDFKKYDLLLWQLVREDISLTWKLDDLLFQLDVIERISFLKYIQIEYGSGRIEQMLENRFNHEAPPSFLVQQAKKGVDEPSPRDLFLIHLKDLSEQFAVLVEMIPEKVKLLERGVKDILERQKVLGKLDLPNDRIDPNDELLDIDEAAKYLKVEKSTMYYYNHKKLLQPLKRGGKLLYYPKSQLDNFWEKKKNN
ncbi:helix-turn-helix domain-containing protein [Rufibacter latericius]|uniref:DNA-binding protein n=1 Tax=Rufibacter latericius TaxID=2487040 RepID=A0A3M9MDV8_9BACT|nr:helix-turn-helix domain-containing protein [Rufibacter latericius]RNI23385.1 DNA-binding protein [Rufibacter latericius]